MMAAARHALTAISKNAIHQARTAFLVPHKKVWVSTPFCSSYGARLFRAISYAAPLKKLTLRNHPKPAGRAAAPAPEPVARRRVQEDRRQNQQMAPL
jgi:hypothetical protein